MLNIKRVLLTHPWNDDQTPKPTSSNACHPNKSHRGSKGRKKVCMTIQPDIFETVHQLLTTVW